jgi:hypothetical protein
MPSVRPVSPLVHNLLAIIEHIASWPCLTVGLAVIRLGLDLAGIPVDLLDLSGSDAVEAIEAEVIVIRAGWAA